MKKIELNVIRDKFGIYPNGCKKYIACGLPFLKNTWVASADEYDEDCPTKLLTSIGQEVEPNHANAIKVIKLKDPKTREVFYIDMALEDYQTKCNCCSSVYITNYNGDKIATYPVGVFNVEGDYLGIANNQQEYLDLWNSDELNQLQGVLELGANQFGFILPNTATVTGVIGLRFWSFDTQANKLFRILLDTDDLVLVPDGTILNGGTSTNLTASQVAGQFTILYATNRAYLGAKAIDYTSIIVGKVYVFHNDTSASTGVLDAEYLAGNAGTINITNFGGYAPKRTEQIVINTRSGGTNKFVNILNWSELTEVKSIANLNRVNDYGGNNFTNLPAFDHMNKLEHIFNVFSTIPPSAYKLMDKTIFPNLTQMIFSGLGVTGCYPFGSFANISHKARVLFLSGPYSGDDTALNDQMIIDFDNSTNGITPVPSSTNPASIQFIGNKTSASDAARTNLINKGLGFQI
jgi:hypothetical protein